MIMTSFIIKAQVSLTVPEPWKKDSECAFCQIINRSAHAYRVYEDNHVVAFLGECTPFSEHRHNKAKVQFADILPLRPGHTLIVPKIHCSRVSELPQDYAAATGKAISRISNALTKGASLPNHDLSTYAVTMLELVAIDNTALNVVCNQEYAQVIPHVRIVFLFYFPTPNHNHQVHYHIIPAPKFSSVPTGLNPKVLEQERPLTVRDMHRKEYELRDDLDEDDAHALAEKIKTHL